ncbi:Longitudinals lacking protein-like [Armadillidium nasatum]|uniref:Longitudinals lacking protein-like n=1 Tax=Armadillidium nasatum TaxID=96803 RepID=A0A5N5T734_9CRUS|nr:Longitudinals lacking protein-like [Armadillidium nasatum]
MILLSAENIGLLKKILVAMASELLKLKWNGHLSSFQEIFQSLRSKSRYTDVTLACEGQLFTVHRLVLASCSQFFDHIFEQTPAENTVIILNEAKAHDIEALLDYMYCGQVDVRQSNLASFIKTAKCLQIKGLACPESSDDCDKDGTMLTVQKYKMNEFSFLVKILINEKGTVPLKLIHPLREKEMIHSRLFTQQFFHLLVSQVLIELLQKVHQKPRLRHSLQHRIVGFSIGVTFQIPLGHPPMLRKKMREERMKLSEPIFHMVQKYGPQMILHVIPLM